MDKLSRSVLVLVLALTSFAIADAFLSREMAALRPPVKQNALAALLVPLSWVLPPPPPPPPPSEPDGGMP